MLCEGMQQAFTYLDELVKEVEKCEVMSCELRKLCDRLGIRCEQQTIEETFNKQDTMTTVGI